VEKTSQEATSGDLTNSSQLSRAYSKKTKNLVLVAFITFGLGLTIFINGIARKCTECVCRRHVAHGRMAISFVLTGTLQVVSCPNASTRGSGPDVNPALRIVSMLTDQVFVLASGRGLSVLLVLGAVLIFARRDLQRDEMSVQLLLPVLMGKSSALIPYWPLSVSICRAFCRGTQCLGLLFLFDCFAPWVTWESGVL